MSNGYIIGHPQGVRRRKPRKYDPEKRAKIYFPNKKLCCECTSSARYKMKGKHYCGPHYAKFVKDKEPEE